MLRKIRLSLAVLFFIAVTALFLDFTGTVHAWLGWTAQIQFLPALLALNVVVVVALVAITLLIGRVYCSVICPLGIFQDIVSWISGKRKKKKYRFSYSPEKKWLRYGVLALFVIAFIAGIGSIVALLAPYSSFGRIVSNLFTPLYQMGNNVLAYFAERAESYTFYETEVWIKSVPTFIIAAVTMIVLIVLAWQNGRTYCNTICPVGTILGVLSRYSLFRIVIDKEKCNSCGLCSRKCKASCINGNEHSIDYSRCVACMDCIDTCKHNAISFTRKRKNADSKLSKTSDTKATDSGRRNFLSIGVAVAATSIMKAQEKKVDGGLAVIEDKQVPQRATAIIPAGAKSAKNFAQHCTACQLCVSACPNGVLRPSTELMSLMQPEMSYERGYCRPECTRCSDVCPTGAIKPITIEEKSSIRIGHAVWIKKNCVPLTDGVECGNCARHCPAGAITMIPSKVGDDNSVKIPAINEALCIGCGACENLCPSRPFSAIYVEGHMVHSEK
ncbi:MAG: 4Fe-4S binding protein [Muribaculaceae bacterium]|nr:4Fe-4S binding protein [Muribaculaceae bacterium]